MIEQFDKIKQVSGKNGNKANSLITMRKAGFNVPNGFVINSDSFDDFLEFNKLNKSLDKDLADGKLSKNTLAEFDKAKIGTAAQKEIESKLDKKKLYAVRSSCTKEDLGNLSFAGQYKSFLFVKPSDILKKVIECYKATYNDNIVAYCQKNHIKLNTLKMSVIVQEMVDADYSGICFTVNPMTGDDKDMLIEVAEGIGENIVSGRNAPENYHYSWFNDTVRYDESNKILDRTQLREIGDVFASIQRLFGYPCDIEFALKDGKLYILQARKVTKIVYGGFDDTWTTADFKDGGVSATICRPFMWSLYEYTWDYVLPKFIADSKILSRKYLDQHVMGDMFFGRPYWNLSVVKEAMSKVVGYREREFDNEYGIKGKYEGDGVTTKFTIGNLAHLARMALAQKKIVGEREANAKQLRADLLKKYNDYVDNFEKNQDNLEMVWRKLTEEDYIWSESSYFWQIFINTIHQSLYKDSLLKHLSEDEYLSVLGGIKDISHLRPFYAMWEASRKIRKNKTLNNYWTETDEKQICEDYLADPESYPELKQIIADYGYHSDKELDVAYERYFEDPTPYIINLKNMIALTDSYGPEHDQTRNEQKYRQIMAEVKKKTGDKKYKKIQAKIKKMREMLWWREEFRDTSTRFYYAVHLYTKALGEKLANDGVLDKASDVWMLKLADLWGYLDGDISAEDLWRIADRNQKYYDSFANYMSDNEIVPGDSAHASNSKSQLHGLGACSGIVTGTARVIEDFSEIERLEEGDILVTKFTDTGWTPKFAILSGIVTEYGGILCHAAIVSREYGIPAIVNCHDAMAKIKDGQIITIDGGTGEIKIGDK